MKEGGFLMIRWIIISGAYKEEKQFLKRIQESYQNENDFPVVHYLNHRVRGKDDVEREGIQIRLLAESYDKQDVMIVSDNAQMVRNFRELGYLVYNIDPNMKKKKENSFTSLLEFYDSILANWNVKEA